MSALLTITIPGINVALSQSTVLYGGIGVAVALVLVIFVSLRGGKKEADPEQGLEENLASLPPPPKGQRHYQLKVMNAPVRIRLVVIAPMGKKTVGKVDAALEEVLRGLGEASLDDKPRVRIWPAQLSAKGFANTFFRNTTSPDPEGRASRWILLAGPARAGNTPVLLGLAVLCDSPTMTGKLEMSETQWGEVLHVEAL
jgi:hypothetical protein